MFCTQIAEAIAHTPLTQLDHLARQVWKAHGADQLTDHEAQTLAEQIAARRKLPQNCQSGAVSKRSPRRVQRSPNKEASIQRRRRLARVSPVPPELVDKFTQGELAVITVVAGEIGRAGACTWCLDRIAAIAGVCKTLVRTAIAKARSLGLLISIQRRRRGQKSLTNVVRALRKSWAALLVRIASRKSRSSDQEELSTGATVRVLDSASGFSGKGFAKAVPG